jgi:hypothetical protein
MAQRWVDFSSVALGSREVDDVNQIGNYHGWRVHDGGLVVERPGHRDERQLAGVVARKPSDFLRARRPYLYSDTPKSGRPLLAPDLLDYVLSTLTSRKQEIDFEEFVRKLAERELCPKLMPQTGPTGGGDSKTDTSTYPVAPELADRWYRGKPQADSTEFWAFAISAKKKWKDKLREDAKKIAGLPTRPKFTYFVTSQLVPDRERAQLEQEITSEHGLRNKILDRKWLVEKTIDNGHADLAIRYLKIEPTSTAQPTPGPRDAARASELDQLLKPLRNPDLQTETDYSLAEKYLEAARLSRELERPRDATEGLLSRARDLAKRGRIKAQQLRAVYETAWTTFWWFDDPRGLSQIYSEAESLLEGSEEAQDSSLVLNLFMLLVAAVRSGALDQDEAKLDAPSEGLRKHLESIAEKRDRPNNAVHARTDLDLLEIALHGDDDKRVAHAFEDLKECLRIAESFGTYPVRQYLDLVPEIGDRFGTHPAYDDLFEEACRIAAQREGDVREGQLLCDRAVQLLRANRAADALRLLGRARDLLGKRESLFDAARASFATVEKPRDSLNSGQQTRLPSRRA